jgi:hypothetical protein
MLLSWRSTKDGRDDVTLQSQRETRQGQRADGVALLPAQAVDATGIDGVQLLSMDGRGSLIPHLHSTLPIPGRALAIALVEDTAYIAAVDGGIQDVVPQHAI